MNLLAPLYALADRVRFRLHRDVGREGEDRAHRWLRRHGYLVTARNWRPPQGGGEIDIVAMHLDRVVFVEVKSRAAGSPTAPERGVDAEKIVALRRAARDYLRRSGIDPGQARFDVVAVDGTTVQHLPDAFAL